MSNFLLAQLVGFIAVGFSIAVFQVNSRSVMLKLGLFAAILYAVHFYMLGAYTGAVMNLIGGARCYTYVKVKPTKRNGWVLVAFILLAGLATVATWQGPISLLALAGSTSFAFAGWHKKPKYIRRWSLIASPLWFAYNFISRSYPGMLIEVIVFGSNLFGQYRFDFKHISHAKRRLARPT